MMKWISFTIVFLFLSSTHALMCVQLLDTEHVYGHHAPSPEIEDTFEQILRSNLNERLKREQLMQAFRDLARRRATVKIADLYYLQKILLPFLPSLNSEQLVHTAVFFSSRNFKVSKKFKIALDTDFIENSSAYGPDLVLTWMQFFVRSEVKPSHKASSKLVAHFISTRTSLSHSDLSYFIFYYSKIYAHQGSIKVVGDFQKAFIGLHNQFGADQLGMIAEALGRLQVKSSKRFARIFLKSVHPQIFSMKHFDLINFSEFLAVQQLPLEADLRSAFLDQVYRKLDSFPKDSLMRMLYNFFLIGDFEAIKETIADSQFDLDYDQLSIASAGTIHLINLYFKHVRSEAPPFSENFDLTQAFISDNRSTNLEDKVEAGLKEQGVEYIKEYQVSSLNFVDFFVPSQNLIIQVDGPTHFIRMENGELRLRSNDVRFNELHEALGYRVLRIRYTDVD